ncbi:MAG TPA: LytTR family DNA-binding domain-containing protein [Myxococcota bacterium]|nr:LytTR family DNA-binding domain-containing protein [Myxococcota bacterium]
MQTTAYHRVADLKSAHLPGGPPVATLLMGSCKHDVGSCHDVPALSQPAPPRVITYHQGAWSFHDVSHVGRFFSADKYTCFLQGGKEHLLTESLNSLEARLQTHGFLRVHRGELVNVAHIVQLRRSSGSIALVLRDGQTVAVSRRQVPALRRYLRV